MTMDRTPNRGFHPPQASGRRQIAAAILAATALVLLSFLVPRGRMPPAGAAAAPAGSLYVLDATWTDQSGRTLTLEQLAGRPRVVAMGYTHCTYACPRIVAQLKRIEAAFQDAGAERAPGLVLVSIDPARDTPGRLAEFADGMRLDPARWTLLTGSDDAVLDLSVLLDVKYRAEAGGDFAHSNALTVLDARGAVAARVEGLNGDLEPAIEVLTDLLDEGARP
ncbi:MAG TPA: SCO family protein [Longimicrobiales bacterium]|nr:SCO family protein [Longimicrobiales bacterium]